MKKAAIGIDNWKLPIFTRHLEGAGYSFEQFPFTSDSMILKVKTNSVAALQKVVEAAQKECRSQ